MRYVSLTVRQPDDHGNQTKVYESCAELGAVFVAQNHEVSISTGRFDENETDEQIATEALTYSDDLLVRVRECLMQWGMTETTARNAIDTMQKSGILFRERA